MLLMGWLHQHSILCLEIYLVQNEEGGEGEEEAEGGLRAEGRRSR